MALGKLVLLACCPLVLGGCEYKAAPPAEWEVAPRTHVCTAEQHTKAEVETKFCNKNTSYFSSACYGFAILRNCTKKVSP